MEGSIGVLEAALIGLLQGVFEWLPISSSGQLALLLASVIGLDPLSAYHISIAAHAGTGLSGIVLSRREILNALRLGAWTRIVLVPLIVGAPIALLVERTLAGIPGDYFNMLIGLFLIITTILLLKTNTQGYRKAETLTIQELTIVGIAQGLAAIPGLSRSAITIATLLALRLEPLQAVRASIAMGAVATLAAAAYQFVSAQATIPLTPATVMVLTSLVTGIVSGGILLSISKKYNNHIAKFTAIIAILAILSALPALQ